MKNKKTSAGLRINFRKLFIGLIIGGFLLLAFSLQLTKVFDFLFIRWEYIFPPVIALYFLSVQPFLNYADGKTYFFSGARVGALLAVVIISLNAIYEFVTQTGFVNQINPGQILLSYGVFTVSYALVGGISHYMFNKNVDAKKADVYKYNYVGSAMIVGAFSFCIAALIAAAGGTNSNSENYAILIPVVFTTFIVVNSHKLPDKDFVGGMYLGAISGFLLSLVFAAVYLILIILKATSLNPLTTTSANGNILLELLVVTIVIMFGYTFIGGAQGLFMKIFDKAL